MSREVLGMHEVAERTGIKIDTLYVMSTRGQLPEADQTVGKGRTKLWYPETIDEWNEKRSKR